MQGLFQFLAKNPYLLLFLAVGLAVWIGRFNFKGYGLGMVAAAIIVDETAPAAYDWGVVRNSWSGPQFYLDREGGNADRTALEGWITEARAHQVLELAGRDYDALKAAAVKRGFRAVPLGVTAAGSVRNAIRHKRSPNLVGMVAGKDRPDENGIYVAHWDQLGGDDKPGADRI